MDVAAPSAGSARVPLPVSLTLETSADCNLTCPMCPRAMGSPANRPMDAAVFAAVQEVLAASRHLQLHGLGEPLMSPVFWQVLDQLEPSDQRFIEVNSNGHLLTPKNIERLLDSPLSRLNLSLDAARPETYRRIRGASLDSVTAKIAALARRRQERGQATPALHINMTLMRENIDELPDFVRLAASLGVDAVDVWHLVQGEGVGNDSSWELEHHGWTFRYPEQHLGDRVEQTHQRLREGMTLAAELGVGFENRPDLWLPS
jgi:MoaA/NifB/PqqE/SkfB family radical SAM enzyme